MSRYGLRRRHRLARFSNALVVLWVACGLQWMLLPADLFSLDEECVMACSLTGDRSCCCTARETMEHAKHGSHPSLSRLEIKAPGSSCPTLATSVNEQRVDSKQLLRSRLLAAVVLDLSDRRVVVEAAGAERRPVDLAALPRPPPFRPRSA